MEYKRSFSTISLIVASFAVVASCGRTSRNERDEPPADPSAGTPGSVPPSGGDSSGGTGGQSGANSTSGASGMEPSAAGGPVIVQPGMDRECTPSDAPGKPCDASHCLGKRCGVLFQLTCEDGVWRSRDASPAWELVCPVPIETVYGLEDIHQGACCGDTLPRNDVLTEPHSCSSCPDAAPMDGDPCHLPSDCSPPLIDCFYRCCCYGYLTWAQCDGKQWHVATACSDK